MKLVDNFSSIECLSALINSRKIVPSSFIEIKKVGRCFTYKCSRNSSALILKELSPKEPLHNQNSKLDLDDKLECEDMFLAINNVKKPKVSIINRTGTHKAASCSTKDYTYAEISRQIPNIPLKIPQLKFIPVIESE